MEDAEILLQYLINQAILWGRQIGWVFLGCLFQRSVGALLHLYILLEPDDFGG